MCCSVVLAIVFGLFAYVHTIVYLETREISVLFVVISEALATLFFIFRSSPETVSAAPTDWLVAILGTLAPFSLRPTTYGALPQAEILISFGTILQIVSLISLNRSFALVAAKRQIKTAWMYRIVRHPLYASYFLIFGGCVSTHNNYKSYYLCIINSTPLCPSFSRRSSFIS